jgi:hypothetical protein
VRYRKYLKPVLDNPERLDQVARPQERTRTFLVSARRRFSPGGMQLKVEAPTADEAVRRVEAGEVPAVGLGWTVVSVVEES